MTAREMEYAARLESMIARIQRDSEQAQRELDESQEQRAEAARSSSMGRDWQDVQRRIDGGQTSLTGVFTGADDSRAAQRLLILSRENIARMADEMPVDLQEELAEANAEYLRIGRGGIAPRPSDDGRPG